MAYAGLPVTLVSGTAAGSIAPVPFVVVGGLPTATASVAGGVKKAATVAAASGSVGATYTSTEQATIQNLQTQFNALLTSLKNAGIVA